MLLAIVAMFATISTANASINREDPPKKRVEWEVSDQCRETNVNYDANSATVTIYRSNNENYKATVHREDGSVRQWNNNDQHMSNSRDDYGNNDEPTDGHDNKATKLKLIAGVKMNNINGDFCSPHL